MENVVLTPYAPNLIESTRSIGYSFETALADIIDNSISNNAKKIDIQFNAQDSPYVAIIDNGTGMDKSSLEQAMRYGSSNSLDCRGEHDLGRFGLGLKMASLSQCRRLTVLTKYLGNINAVSWDLDHIYKTKNWSLISYSEEEAKKILFYESLQKIESGTVIIWEKLDRISESDKDFEKEFNSKLDFADRHIALVFHRYLESKLNKKNIEIYFNKRKVEPIDPFMTNNKGTQILEEETLFIDRQPIKIQPFIMPYISKLTVKEKQVLNQYKDLNLNQGLYIYRNRRLIIWGKWFYLLRDAELSRLARIRIDIPNTIDEFWKIDVKKSNAQIPSIIKEQLKQIIIRSVGKSEKVYKYRGRQSKADNLEHVWNRIENRDKVEYLINKDLPIFKVLESSLTDEQACLLNGFVKSVESAFPYGAVYYDLAKDSKIEEKSMSMDEAYEIGKNVLENSIENKRELVATLDTLKITDLFQQYPNVIKMLEEEFMYE